MKNRVLKNIVKIIIYSFCERSNVWNDIYMNSQGEIYANKIR